MNNTIVLLGMSGVGKSYHSKRLQSFGYKVFHIDDMIAHALGEGDVRDIALWLGAPYEDRYAKHSAAYLALEDQFTKEALTYAEQHPDERIVIDTTGSFIYLSPDALSMLAKVENSVLLDTGEDVVEKMIATYLREPKPVIWGDMAGSFTKDGYLKEVEVHYPELLKTRRALYRQHAKKIVASHQHKSKDWNVREVLKG